jgi:hypothetical protein
MLDLGICPCIAESPLGPIAANNPTAPDRLSRHDIVPWQAVFFRENPTNNLKNALERLLLFIQHL